MLPDFPDEKEIAQAQLTKWLKSTVRARLGPFGGVATHRQHEGDRWTPTSLEGTSQEKNFPESSASIVFTPEEITKISDEAVLKNLLDAANSMAAQISVRGYETLREATERVGNVIDAGGKSLTPDMILDSLDRIQMDFDSGGNPVLPTIVVGPQLEPKFREVLSVLESDPVYGRRGKEIIVRQREEWRDREASRRLVN